jgi:transcriptional regulator with XRE-family HTH domain
MTLGEKIRNSRKNLNISQKELAEMIGVGRLHITKIENGVEFPSIAFLAVLGKKLKMSKINRLIKELLT